MPEPLEAFLPDVYIAGSFHGTPAELLAQLNAGTAIELRDLSLVHIANLLRGAPDRLVSGSVSPDEVLLVAGPPDPGELHVHAVYYTVELWMGPYQVAGEMATPPGFDPGRALVRATSNFLVLRDARVRIATPAGNVDQAYERLLVNRYAVERATGEIELAFWFPGAAQEPAPSV